MSLIGPLTEREAEFQAEAVRQARIANGAMMQAEESAKIQARLRMDVVRVEKQLKGAVTALRNYGSHKWTCAALASTRDRKVPCDCGWDTTLAAYRGQ